MPSSAWSNAPEPAGDGPSSTQRLFIAIDAPPPIAAALGALGEPARAIRWTPLAQLHLTLRFLGDTPTPLIARLCARLRQIHVARFLLPVEGLGVFPPRGQPKVLWSGVGSGHPHLHQLRQKIDDALLALGLEADLRHFVPHFTLARLGAVSPAHVAQWLHRHREFAAAPFRVEAFKLYSSRLKPEGAEHNVIESFHLD